MHVRLSGFAVIVLASIAACTPATRAVKLTIAEVPAAALAPSAAASTVAPLAGNVKRDEERVVSGPWDVRLGVRLLDPQEPQKPGDLDALYDYKGMRLLDPRAPGGVRVPLKDDIVFSTCDSPYAKQSEFVAWLNANQIVLHCPLAQLLGLDDGAPLRTAANVALSDVGDSELSRIVELRSLKSLKIWGTRLTDAGIEHLKGLTKLQKLNLIGTNVTGAIFEHLKGMTKLQELNLGASPVTSVGLEHLKGVTSLQTLTLIGTRVTDAGLEHLKGMTKLQKLDLTFTGVTDAGLEHLKGMTELQDLRLGNTGVTDAGLEHLKGLTMLRVLCLRRNPNPAFTGVTDVGLEHLKGMTKLQKLDLTMARVTDAGLEHLKGMTNLHELNLTMAWVTDAGLEHLKGLTELQKLDLTFTEVTDAGLEHLKGLSTLQNLNLQSTEVTDAGLEHLKGLTVLQELDLSGTKVTDTGLEHLKSRSTLQTLDLRETNVSAAAIARLRGTTTMTIIGLTPTKKEEASSGKDRRERLANSIRDTFLKKNIMVSTITCPPAANQPTVVDLVCVLETPSGEKFNVNTKRVGSVTNYELDAAALVASKVEKFIEERYEKKEHHRATAKCPAGVIVKKPGDQLKCDFTDDKTNKASTATVTVVDNSGNVQVSF